MPLNVGLSTCRSLCQHPGCWDSVRKQQKGITKSLAALDSSSSDDSDSELDLPTQSVCNLLSDFGESPKDRYPVSTGGRPSHKWDTLVNSPSVVSKATASSPKKLQAPNNTKASLFSKGIRTAVPSERVRAARMPLLEVQEVFDCADLNSQWDETFVTKQYYMWVDNPHKKRKKRNRSPITSRVDQNGPVLLKDMTEVMVPVEIKHQREDTVLFDDWPVLKKKQPRTASPPCKSLQFKKALPAPAPVLPPPSSNVDMDGINELLALPKDVLVKVLEQTKKSDFTSKGKLHHIVAECVQDNEAARLMLNTRELLKQKKMDIHQASKSSLQQSQHPPSQPVYQLDDEIIIERMSSANTPVRDKAASDDDSSVESFPRYTKPLPKINAHSQSTYQLVRPGKLIEAPESARGLIIKAKLPSISLGLPELPSGVKTTKAFAYSSKDYLDFTLGPMVSPPSTHRSSMSGDYSEHGTTIKVNVPLSGVDYMDMVRDYEMVMHSVSPALSTNVPMAPAGTPATFMSPSKSAPNLREASREPTQITVNLSIKAQPSSKDMRETTFLSSPASNNADGQHNVFLTEPSPGLEPGFPATPDDKAALGTIRETAREASVDGSVIASSHRNIGEKLEEPLKLQLQASTMTSINTGMSPAPKSARSIESCPSPEQWPLISESSFEKIVSRPSISEPALSGRSGRRSRGQGDNSGRDYARKVMDEKRTIESPAPPPPSPEPKDTTEYRARKDLKSRESLSMAPLFEVNEMEEIEQQEDRLVDRDGRRKQVRKIHAVIPQADCENEKKISESEAEDSQEVMVSQITVTHVAPKGVKGGERGGKGTNEMREKVQETFLNVDIPAEEISSCKAEHGSSRLEDVSSTNDSMGAKSEVTTTTESQVSTTGNEVTEKEEDAADEKNKENDEDTNEADNKEVTEPLDTTREINLNDQQYLEDMQYENLHSDRYDSARLNSEYSGGSLELMCDSARFVSHDLVSPMEGETEGGETMRLLSLLQEIEDGSSHGEDTGGLGSEVGERVVIGEEVAEKQEDDDKMAENAEGKKEIIVDEPKESDSVLESSGKEREETTVSKSTDESSDIEPPGSFFFNSNEEMTDCDVEEGKEEEKKKDSSNETSEDFKDVKGDTITIGDEDSKQVEADKEIVETEESKRNEDAQDGSQETEEKGDEKNGISTEEPSDKDTEQQEEAREDCVGEEVKEGSENTDKNEVQNEENSNQTENENLNTEKEMSNLEISSEVENIPNLDLKDKSENVENNELAENGSDIKAEDRKEVSENESENKAEDSSNPLIVNQTSEMTNEEEELNEDTKNSE